MKSPEQELYDYFYTLSEKTGWTTYDHLPMKNENAPYPFVIVGNMESTSGGTKTSLNSNISLIIDVWGNAKQRLVVSNMAERFFRTAIGLVETDNYRFFGSINEQDKQLMQDTTVPDTVLNRGMVTLNLKMI